MKQKNRLFMGIVSMMFFITACGGKVVEELVSEQDAQAFARELEKNIASGNGKFVDDVMQWEVFYNRMVAAPGALQKKIDRKDFRMLVKALRIGEKMTKEFGPDASFALVRSYRKAGKQHLVFRIFAEEAMNYYDYELTKVNGKIFICDMFIYLSGDYLSSSMLDILQHSSASIRNIDPELMKAQQMLHDGKYKEAVQMVDRLPEEWKKIRMVYGIKLQAAARYDPALFETTFAEYKTLFPAANKIDLIMMDNYFAQEKYIQALQSVNKLGEQVGQDPILDLHRGLIYFRIGRQDSSIFYLERLLSNMPQLEYGCEQLLHIYELSGEKEKAARAYAGFKQKNILRSKTMQSLEESYPDLAK